MKCHCNVFFEKYQTLKIFHLENFGRDVLLDVKAGVEGEGDLPRPQVLPLLTQLTLHPLHRNSHAGYRATFIIPKSIVKNYYKLYFHL